MKMHWLFLSFTNVTISAPPQNNTLQENLKELQKYSMNAYIWNMNMVYVFLYLKILTGWHGNFNI